VNGIPDGQLFWIIRHGSPDTAMPPSRNLNDQQVWQLVAYIRQLANYRL
jgi:mono/diheme cytochrome c family protein